MKHKINDINIVLIMSSIYCICPISNLYLDNKSTLQALFWAQKISKRILL